MKLSKFLLPVLVVAGFAIYLSLFVVKEINQAIVLQFGDPKKVIVEPGLQVKIPFIQNVVFLDRRILNLDAPPEEVIASDQKRLIVDAYARFKIIDPLKFYISVGDERVARSRLSTIINSRIRNVLGQEELQTLLSKDRSKQMALIKEGVNNEAQNIFHGAALTGTFEPNSTGGGKTIGVASSTLSSGDYFLLVGGNETDLSGGTDDYAYTAGEVNAGYDLFLDTEETDVDFVLMGGSMGSETDTKTKAQKAVAIAAARKDCVAFVSAFKGNQVGSGGSPLTS